MNPYRSPITCDDSISKLRPLFLKISSLLLLILLEILMGVAVIMGLDCMLEWNNPFAAFCCLISISGTMTLIYRIDKVPKEKHE